MIHLASMLKCYHRGHLLLNFCGQNSSTEDCRQTDGDIIWTPLASEMQFQSLGKVNESMKNARPCSEFILSKMNNFSVRSCFLLHWVYVLKHRLWDGNMFWNADLDFSSSNTFWKDLFLSPTFTRHNNSTKMLRDDTPFNKPLVFNRLNT